jgi:HNH endonuclease
MRLSSRDKVIEHLLHRDGHLCYLCDEPLNSDITIDHVVPKSRGGSEDVDNFKLAHFRCNQDKADRLFLDDGSLEPKSGRPPRMHKSERPELCDECHNGRLLSEHEACPLCDHAAGPDKFPHFAKRLPRDCDHDHETWCWMCGSGLVRRSAPYIYT